MANIAPDRVAVYIRWSTDDQGEGTTLETQTERCRHFLASQGWLYDEALVYVDDGYSGGTLDRPAIARLRRDVRQGRVQCVVVYKIDRLSRSVVDIVDLVLREWEGRCFVKSASEEINTLTPAGKMFFYMLVSFAEYERNVIKDRTMSGKIKRAEQGRNPGFRPPFGYVKGDATGTFAVVEHEAAVVRRIFALYRVGNGAAAIAHTLNGEGALRRGRPWSELGVRRLLRQPAYVGVLTYGRQPRRRGGAAADAPRSGAVQGATADAPRLTAVEGAFPSIVDRALWDHVQAQLAARSTRGRTAKPTYSDYLLAGVAACRCGAPVGGKRVKGRAYYYCTARKRQGAAVCDAGYAPADAVDGAVAQEVRALLRIHAPPLAARVVTAEVERQMAEARAELTGARLGQGAQTQRARRLEQDYRSGQLPANLYAQELEALSGEQRATAGRIDALARRLALLEGARTDQHPFLTTFQADQIWNGLTVPERKQLLRHLTRSLVLYRQARSSAPPTLEIAWVQVRHPEGNRAPPGK